MIPVLLLFGEKVAAQRPDKGFPVLADTEPRRCARCGEVRGLRLGPPVSAARIE